MSARVRQTEFTNAFQEVLGAIGDTRKFIADALVMHESKGEPFTPAGRRRMVRRDIIKSLESLGTAEWYVDGLERQIVYGWATRDHGSAEDAEAARVRAGIPPRADAPPVAAPPAATPKRVQAMAEILAAAEYGQERSAYALHQLGRVLAAFRTGDHEGAKDRVVTCIAALSEISTAFDMVSSEHAEATNP